MGVRGVGLHGLIQSALLHCFTKLSLPACLVALPMTCFTGFCGGRLNAKGFYTPFRIVAG